MEFAFSILFFILGSISQSFAQGPFDCANAYQVCSGETFRIDYDDVPATTITNFETTCLSAGLFGVNPVYPQIWLQYNFIKSGKFVFTIHSDSTFYDFDFIVYKASNGCDDLENVRCIATGVNSSSDEEHCKGDTGLRESSTDFIETAGCNEGDDNFLAAIDVNPGDQYYVMITEYTSYATMHFSMTHDNPDIIGCTTLGNNDILNHLDFNIYPNPASQHFTVQSNSNQIFNVELKNILGQTTYSGTLHNDANIDVSGLESGIYFLGILEDGDVVGMEKVVVE